MIRTRPVTCERCGRAWRVSLECVVCPDCGESAPNYTVDGVPFCGLHETAMLPCRMTGLFLTTTFTREFHEAWAHFPNARVDCEPPQAGQPTIESYYCPVCERVLRSWRSAEGRD